MLGVDARRGEDVQVADQTMTSRELPELSKGLVSGATLLWSGLFSVWLYWGDDMKTF